MNESQSRKHQVSLRGASAKEITRDALIEKVNHERELRNYARRANAAVLLIQRVWRGYYSTNTTALWLQQEWETRMRNCGGGGLTKMQVSREILRPFLFFVDRLSVRCGRIGDGNRDCMIGCFRIILERVTSKDVHQNFCSMATGSIEERNIWLHQTRKLISVCLFILSIFDYSSPRVQDVVLTSLAMRLAVVLTDPKDWNCIVDDDHKDAKASVKNLVQFVGSKASGLYNCIRKFICKLEAPFSFQEAFCSQTDDRLVIVASAITLSLRPFHITNMDINDNGMMERAFEQYCVSIFTIPWLPLRLPKILVPALRHESVLSPCLRILLISKEKILKEMSEMDRLEITSNSKMIPRVGWALANLVHLATVGDTNTLDSGKFTAGLDFASYLHVVVILADNLLASLDNCRWTRRQNEGIQVDNDPADSFFLCNETTCGLSKLSYMDLFRPVCQQWHLNKLIAFGKDEHSQICELMLLISIHACCNCFLL